MLGIFERMFLNRVLVSSLNCLRRAMSDLAAGKKAAAVKAVNDWVKVCSTYEYRMSTLAPVYVVALM